MIQKRTIVCISVAVSILVIAQPVSFGLVQFVIMISIAFRISGIEMMVFGISGREWHTRIISSSETGSWCTPKVCN